MIPVGVTQRVSVQAEYGERRDCLDQEWTVLLEGLGYRPIPLPNRIEAVRAYLDALALDAVVLTSGNDPAWVSDPTNPAPERDAFETALLDYTEEESLPVLGVCRGLEILNDYYGGDLTPVSESAHVDCTHRVEFDAVARDVALPDRSTVNSYHQYGIRRTDVAPDLGVVGTAPDGSVECVVHRSRPVWGIMWHPERTSPSADLDRRILDHVLGGGDR